MDILRIYQNAQRHRRKRAVLPSIRRSFAVFGIDVSGMTDEELERKLLDASLALGRCGVTVEEASERLSACSREQEI